MSNNFMEEVTNAVAGENSGYRCFKCEGRNVRWHGLYCPNKKNNAEKLLEKIKQQTDEAYNEKD